MVKRLLLCMILTLGGSSLARAQTNISAISYKQGPTTTQSITSAAAGAGIDVTGYSYVWVMYKGTYTTNGTTAGFNLSGDSGTTYYGAPFFQQGTTNPCLNLIATGALTANSTNIWIVPTNGANRLQTNGLNWATGTIAVTLVPYSSPVSPCSMTGNLATDVAQAGNLVNPGVPISGSDYGGTPKSYYVKVDSGGLLSVNTHAVTVASGGIASGAIASGAIASGAVASGAFASGAIGSGAVASGAVASGAFASGAISDGAVVTLGAQADAKSTATDTTAITIMQVLKQISASVQAPPSQAVTNTGTFAAQAAITAASGSIASGAIASGAFASGAVGSGAIASGAIASGAVASGAFASGSIASGAIASGAIAAGAIAAGATSIAENEDVASADADRGVKILAVRKATPANTSGADGDYEFVQMSAGRVWTTATIDGGITVDVAHDAAASGVNPALIGGYASAAAPADVSADTDSVRAWHLRSGAYVVQPSYAGVLASTGNGTAGTGVPRVVVASDNTPFPIKTDQTTHGTTDKVAADVYVGAALASATNPLPVVFPGTLVSGAITTAMTGTTSTSLVGLTASNYLYITSCTVSNASTTVSTDIVLQDGSGGTTLWTFPGPAASVATTGGGGATHGFGVAPLKVPTAGNALYAANVTTGSSTKISCNGFRSTVSY